MVVGQPAARPRRRPPPRRPGRPAPRRAAAGGPPAAAGGSPPGSWRPCPSCRRRRGPRRQPSLISPENGCDLPVAGVGGHDVEVAVDEQGRAGRGPCPRSGRPTLARPGCDSVDLGVQPDLGEQRGDVFGCVTLPGPEWSPRLLVSILIRSLQRAATSSSARDGRCGSRSPAHRRRRSRPRTLAWCGRGLGGRVPRRLAAGGRLAGCRRICYRDAADTEAAVLRPSSGWRNWQTR